jgi:hypothetical protein
MIEILVSMGFVAILVAVLWVPIRGRKGSEDSVKQSFAILDQVLEDAKERTLREEEALALSRRLVEQGDGTIALLNAIRDNLDHRSIKN